MKTTMDDVLRAAESAVRDERSGTGGYYNGPATGVYLRIRGILQTFRVQIEGVDACKLRLTARMGSDK